MSNRWLIHVTICLGVAIPLQGQATVRNPHGPLAIACQNCHTTIAWAPLRANPEFNHNTDTRFPLRGLHESVSCNSCHISKVFTNAGTRCADCHADFHRRQFGAKCETCHTVQGWRANTRPTQDHWNRFPLLGAHSAAACDSCHKGAATGVYIGLNTQCVSCHVNDFARTTSPDHRAAGLPTACETCHAVDNWRNAKFDHNRFTKFVLTGLHQSLECSSCHTGNRFQGTPTDCFTCHSSDFSRTSNPNHVAAGFPKECSLCHTTASWAGASFDHSSATKFPLTGAHTTVSCVGCHVGGRFAGTPTACSNCHMADYEKTTNPNHTKSNFPVRCETCHTAAAWQGATFDHNLSKFPLTGAHTSVSCNLCHANGQYSGVNTDCASCHLKDFQAAKTPDHVAASFPQNCTLCHTTTQWRGAQFDHGATKFPLTGKHSTATCTQCHVTNVYSGLSADCTSCHLNNYQGTKNPNHVAAGFSQNCQACHTTTKWQGAQFDHGSTKFPLTGSHAAVTCTQCHQNGQYAGLATECSSCHLNDYQKTTSPNHAAAGFPQNCSLCHNTTKWQGVVFNHDTQTKFALTGAHTSASCLQCHANGVYAGLSSACASCHLNDFQGAKNPNHVAAGFSQNCQACHTTTKWQGAQFDHNSTKFPLTGSHAAASCTQCHQNGKYAGLATECSSCHLNDYQKTTNPNHAAAGFPQNCSLCHNTTKWQGAAFNHNTQTKFPLTGKHSSTTCMQCHANNVFAGLGTACATCHLNDYQKTANPNHTAAGFSQDCSICHTTTSWTGATFDHSKTRFPLTGKHATAACSTCHVNNQYATLSTACSNCHLNDYQKTTNPGHAAAGFPQDCSQCHTTTGWTGATFDHSTRTKFPLTGKHTAVTCSQCHVNNVFAGLGTACESCHLKSYQATSNPNHASAGFPQTCALCHTTSGWTPASFNHTTQTKFPLTGKHTSTTCIQCHSSGVYAGLNTACSSCHLNEYQKTTNPNHAAAGFPQDCSLCHTTTAWTGATFNHNNTKFPLTGKHTTTACSACHVNNQYAGLGTACSNCHLAAYNQTKNPNHVTAGFPTDCSLCHTTTQWLGATFNHSTTGFALTGKHATTSCALCHVGGKFAGTPTDCYSCHTSEYNTATNPNHIAAGFPKTCNTCHTTTSWLGATFNHTWFPTNHGKAGGVCSTCHTNSNDYKVFTCTNCHLQAQTDSKHKGQKNYVYNSINCYNCHPAGKN
jgi:hypothetical protein